MAIKDVISTKGIKTTCSSKMLTNYVPVYDATVMRNLYDAGAVIVGKSNMDEFAMGSSTENSAFFTTHNPWDLERVPGGSSGGSAASVACGEAVFSLGSDTGGSIRQPAGFTSVVGLKPTYGRVSRYGLVAFASSLDQIGPLTLDVTDCALVMNVISGWDNCDSTSVHLPVPDYTTCFKQDIKGLRIGIPKEYFVKGMQPGVESAIKAAIAKLEELGAIVDWNVSLPHTPYALAVYYIMCPLRGVRQPRPLRRREIRLSPDTDNMWEAMEKTRQYGFGPESKDASCSALTPFPPGIRCGST